MKRASLPLPVRRRFHRGTGAALVLGHSRYAGAAR